jgi:hypothetical protein
MKIVKIFGGLGNQMFQYAFANSLGRHTLDEIFFDLSSYRTNNMHNGFELDRVFNIYLNIVDDNRVYKYATLPDTFYKRIRRKYFTKKTHYIERKFAHQADVFRKPDVIYYEGYWQSEKYFLDIDKQLRSQFKFIGQLNNKTKTFLDSMPHPITSIHVRRGDYLSIKAFNTCGKIYYENAIKKINMEFSNVCFLVFSDDINWCRDNLKFEKNRKVFFVNWNIGLESWQDMFLMSKCDHNIIANSTFSWWGAWLNENSNKIVLAPDIWCNTSLLNTSYYDYKFADIIPGDWLLISTQK